MIVSVYTSVCPLYEGPSVHTPRCDEVLCGEPVALLDVPRPGWRRVRTEYGYEGFAPDGCLALGPLADGDWPAPNAQRVLSAFCQVQTAPSVRAPALALLPRGALVVPWGTCPCEGWTAVRLSGGRRGYVPSGVLAPPPPSPGDEAAFRASLVRTALLYLGTPYRWGGRSPLGLDCSGLVFTVYQLHGITIFRDARMEPGFPIYPAVPEDRKPGDLLYFPGHVALSLGSDRYIHATAHEGAGVRLNSLSPGAPDYRPDLAASLAAVGTYL